jgi:hypothetical protein
VVGEKLEWDNIENGLKKLVGLRHWEKSIGQTLNLRIPLMSDSDDRSTSGLNLLQAT